MSIPENPEQLSQGQNGGGGSITNHNTPTQNNPNNPQGSSRVSPGWYVAGGAMLLIFLYFAFFNKKDDGKKETVKSTIEQSDAPTSTKENQDDSKGKSGSGQSNKENNSTSNSNLAENEVMYGGAVRVYEEKGIYYNGNCNGRNFVFPNYQILEKGSDYSGIFCAVALSETSVTLAVDEDVASKVIRSMFGNDFRGDYLADHLLGRTSADNFSAEHQVRREKGYICFDVNYDFGICPGYVDWCYLIVNPTNNKKFEDKYYPGTFDGNSNLPTPIDHYRISPCDMKGKKEKPKTVSSTLK